MRHYLTILLILLISAMGVYAQGTVTQDDVTEVAARMFCPVCENEPLDQCYNPTCIQWKNEIRDLLTQGYTNDEIITSFVERYGDQVVGVPQDPMLRVLSFSAPLLATLIALAIGVTTFLKWRRAEPMISSTSATVDPITNADSYRSQIERDLM